MLSIQSSGQSPPKIGLDFLEDIPLIAACSAVVFIEAHNVYLISRREKMNWRGKTVCMILAAECYVFTGCAPPPRSQPFVEPCFEKKRLTQKLVDDYGITRQELLQLEFYLENGFVLHRQEVSHSKRVTPDHRLDLKKQTTRDSIEFPDGIPGRPVAVEEPRGLFDFSYHIKIKFEIEPELCLSFTAPVWRGGFILEKSFMLYEIISDDLIYRCEDWDQPHFLLVCMRSIKK